MTRDVSICAVTFRRPTGLSRLLESLARLKLPEGTSAEVVLVDNDPLGSAFHAARRADRAGGLPVRWHHEPRGNIAHARNRCVDAAAGRWVAFIDDDEVAHEEWLAAYWSISQSVEADGYFGPVLPRLEQERVHWLDLEAFYARPRHATGCEISSGMRTGNAYVRRALLRELRFDPRFGVTGGEDTECFLRALSKGSRFVWCDEARVDEFVPPERHCASYLMRRALKGGAIWSAIERRHRRRSALARWATLLPRLGLRVALLPVAALRGRRSAFRAWLGLCVQAGRLHGLLVGLPSRRSA